MMDAMLVEDDEFKAADIARVVLDNIPGVVIQRAASVNSALKAISIKPPHVMLLDMSLPTFDLSGPGGGGSPQSQGGIEVLRLSRRLKQETIFFIITQYPGIEIDGIEVPLSGAAAKLSKKFNVEVCSCIGYDFENDQWRALLTTALQTRICGEKL